VDVVRQVLKSDFSSVTYRNLGQAVLREFPNVKRSKVGGEYIYKGLTTKQQCNNYSSHILLPRHALLVTEDQKSVSISTKTFFHTKEMATRPLKEEVKWR
jgi:hypothetical protein